MKGKCVFFISSYNLVHIIISFCCNFQGPIDLVTPRWESVTLSNMRALNQLCSGKLKVGYMHFCTSANKPISAASAGIFTTLICWFPLSVFFQCQLSSICLIKRVRVLFVISLMLNLAQLVCLLCAFILKFINEKSNNVQLEKPAGFHSILAE